MEPRSVSLILLLQLLLIAAIGLFSCSATQSTQEILSALTTTNPRGIRGALIHRDSRYFPSPDAAVGDGYLSYTDALLKGVRRSKARVQKLSRGRRLAVANSSVDWETPLSDASEAAYVMEISLGTPPRKFVAIADTGSDLTWLQCLPCESCFKQPQTPFSPANSSTYAPLSCSSTACKWLNETGSFCPYVPGAPVNATTGCEYGYGYGDGSITIGSLSRDTITLQTVSGSEEGVPDYWFGCSDHAASNSSLFDEMDGLVGLGQGNISFPVQLGHYFGSKFGYCLVNRSSQVTQESPLYFGDAAVPTKAVNGQQLQFTPIITNPVTTTFYYVGWDGITVNGVAVSIPAADRTISKNGTTGGIFFDSGTTYTSLVDGAFDPLIAAVSAATPNYTTTNKGLPYFELCYDVKYDSWVDEAPKLSFKFANSTSFDLGAEGSWVEYDRHTTCLAFMRTTGVNIFGNVQQVGFHILYDLEEKQIGFVPADCNATTDNFLSSSGSSHRAVLSVAISVLAVLLSLIFS